MVKKEDSASELKGSLKVKRIQLSSAVHFQKSDTGKTYHPVFVADERLSIIWHVELGCFEIKDPKDHIFVPVESVTSFSL